MIASGRFLGSTRHILGIRPFIRLGKEERMTIKTGAVRLGFVSGLAWLGAGLVLCCGPVRADEVAAAGSEAAVPSADFRAAVEARVAELQSADLEALQEAKAECERVLQELAVEVPTLRRAVRDRYEELRLNSDAAKEIYAQIAELEQKLDRTLREMPEVKEQLEKIQDLEQSMLTEMQVRTALSGLIAEREKQEPAPAE